MKCHRPSMKADNRGEYDIGVERAPVWLYRARSVST